MKCSQIKKMILAKDSKSLINEYNKLINSGKINPLIIDIKIYNMLEYLPNKERIKNSISIDFNNELEYWMWLASPLLFEFINTK